MMKYKEVICWNEQVVEQLFTSDDCIELKYEMTEI